MQLIGIDCATDPRGMGFARGWIAENGCRVESAAAGSTSEENIELVLGWLKSSESTLLCVDAPLGWPVALSASLHSHAAGNEVDGEPNQMFRRETDREIKRRLNKQPLDVGADRIARTAHSALRFLGILRKRSRQHLPLAWTPNEVTDPQVIEVYPAATLVAHGFRDRGYKAKDDVSERAEILAQLRSAVSLPCNPDQMLASADALDAAVCVLAGYDFVRGCCAPPEDLRVARSEGWIWARTPDAAQHT